MTAWSGIFAITLQAVIKTTVYDIKRKIVADEPYRAQEDGSGDGQRGIVAEGQRQPTCFRRAYGGTILLEPDGGFPP